MKRNVRIWTVVIVAVLVVAISGAWATESNGKSEIDRGTNVINGGAKKLARQRVAADRPPFPLPMPIRPDLPSAFRGGIQETNSLSLGGVMTSRGGAMSTPQQLAEREIRKLIGNLG